MSNVVDLEPGIYFGLDYALYRRDIGLNYSSIKTIDKEGTYAYWKQSPFNPDARETNPTPEMRFGTMYHAMLLEPDSFGDKFYIFPGEPYVNGNSKERVNRTDYIKAQHMRAEFMQSEHCRNLIGGYGYPEVTIVWVDPEHGIKCKCRHDFFKSYSSTDIKVRYSVSDASIKNAFHKFAYNIQCIHYIESRILIRDAILKGEAKVFGQVSKDFIDDFLYGMADESGVRTDPMDMFVFIFQSPDDPYEPRIINLEGQGLISAQKTITSAALQWKACIKDFGLDKPWRREACVESFCMYNGSLNQDYT